MKIKYRRNAVFGLLMGMLILWLTACGVSFCGFFPGAGEEMVFSCADEESVPEEPVREESAGEPENPQPEAGAGDTGDREPYARLVDINTAGAEELMTLSGIGETRAAAIIAFREQNGPFAHIEEIMMIPGIKEGIFSRIKDQIVVE